MTQHSSVDDELHNLLDSFFEPSKDEKYVRDLERDIMALIEAEATRRCEALLDRLESHRAIIPLNCNHTSDECRCKRFYVVGTKYIEAARRELRGEK